MGFKILFNLFLNILYYFLMSNNEKNNIKYNEEQYNTLIQERSMLKMTIDFLSTQNMELNNKIISLENKIQSLEKENLKLNNKINNKENIFKKENKYLRRYNSVLITKDEKKILKENKITDKQYELLHEINQLKFNLSLLENNKDNIQSLISLSDKINIIKSNQQTKISLNDYFSIIEEENNLNKFFDSNSKIPLLLSYNEKIFELIPRIDINQNDLENNPEKIKTILPENSKINKSTNLTFENILIS